MKHGNDSKVSTVDLKKWSIESDEIFEAKTDVILLVRTDLNCHFFQTYLRPLP